MAGEYKGARRQFGKYNLIAHLATGGMAEIYLASQTALAGFEKLVVIKRILPNLARDPDFVRMFLDEARIAATLSHHNVVQIFDLGCIEGQYFMAMEYLAGESLSTAIMTCLDRKTIFPPELAAGVIAQAAEGLHHAHTMKGKGGRPLNIVHRDVSPQNVFVLYDGVVKVVDFGIAKAAMRQTQTRTGMLKGKFAYMSPEQVLGEELDGRSDVFSLGIVLWECLTCRKLFRQENDLELLKAITLKDAPSPATVNPSVPRVLAEITLRALARDREQRYRSAAEFRSALRDLLKTTMKDSDNVAIGRFMQDIFSERIKEKRSYIESARVSGPDLGEYLFGDLTDYVSDTDFSIPKRTPTVLKKGISEPRPRRRAPWQRLILLLLLVVIAGFGLAKGLLFSVADGDGPDAGPDATVSPPKDKVQDGGPAATASPPKDEVQDGGSAAADKLIAAKIPEQAKKVKKRRGIVRWEDDVDDPMPPGKLRLITVPWTDVYHRGRKLGQTPLVDVKLPAGRIKLRAVNAKAGIDRTITVRIKPGKVTTKRFDLQ